MGEDRVEAEVGAMKEGWKFGETEGEAFGRGRAERDVAEFAAGAWGFSIEMQMSVGNGKDFRGFRKVADEIEHGAIASGTR